MTEENTFGQLRPAPNRPAAATHGNTSACGPAVAGKGGHGQTAASGRRRPHLQDELREPPSLVSDPRTPICAPVPTLKHRRWRDPRAQLTAFNPRTIGSTTTAERARAEPTFCEHPVYLVYLLHEGGQHQGPDASATTSSYHLPRQEARSV